MTAIRDKAIKSKVFLAWRIQVLEMSNEALKTECSRLEKDATRRLESIWTMRRVELEEVARRELGMTEGILKRETVVTLREKLRAARAAATDKEDPMMRVPPGLDRMRADLLAEECKRRGLDPQDTSRKSNLKTRPQMIVMIRDDVTARITQSEAPPTKTAARSAATTRSSSQKRQASVIEASMELG